MKKKKIAILALHLGYGGIERAISDLANSLTNNYQVEIISTYHLYDNPINTLNSNIKVFYLMDLKPNREIFKQHLKKFNLWKVFQEGTKSIKILFLKKYLMVKYIKNSDADVLISTRDIHNKWVGTYAKEKLKIGWEHNHHHGNKKYIKRIINSCKNLDYFVLVSKDLTNFYQDKVRPKCIYIPNSVEIPQAKSLLKDTNMISIGRLSKEKGFLDLIEIFQKVHNDYQDWKLYIVGDGIEKEKITNKIKEYHLDNNIIMCGFLKKEEINEMLKKTSIYVMTSLTESFGIVLLEAFSYGIPAIAFDSAEGACELIENNQNGYLISNRNKELMAKKIKNLIENKQERQIMGEKALNIAHQYSKEIVLKKWLDIIE